jgi:hypothetical protein
MPSTLSSLHSSFLLDDTANVVAAIAAALLPQLKLLACWHYLKLV